MAMLFTPPIKQKGLVWIYPTKKDLRTPTPYAGSS